MRALPCLLAASLACLLAACSGGDGDSSSQPTAGSAGSDTSNQGGSQSSAGSSGSGQGGDVSGSGGGGQGGSGQAGSDTGGSGGSGAGGSGGSGGSAGGGLGPDQCMAPPAGVEIGTEIGQQLPNFIIKDCDGQDYSLEQICGADGVWLFAAFGWCPLCKNVSQNAEALHDSFAGKGLASAIVVVETAALEPPTENYCQIWREMYGLEDVLTLYDPSGSFVDIWPQKTSSLSVFLDHDRIVVDKLYHEGSIDVIKADIQKALDK